jgi:hypothetical protein
MEYWARSEALALYWVSELHRMKNIQPLWAEGQTDDTGIDPLQCTNCDKPLTFLGCFFGNWNQFQHLFVRAGKGSTIAAVLLRPG